MRAKSFSAVRQWVAGSRVSCSYCWSSSALRIRTAAIAFNPAYHLSMYGHLLIGPQRNYVTQEEYEWTMEHSDELRALERSVQFDAPSPFFVYVDEGDEVIGWEAQCGQARPHFTVHLI